MQVDNIEIGTVVDHIKAGQAPKVMRLLGIGDEYPHRVAVVMHVPSKKMKTKDIVKIEGKVVSKERANILALVAPEASVNIIKNGKVEEKYRVKLPEKIEGVGKCPNPKCISNTDARPKFEMEKKQYRCYYCERIFKTEELV